jgi:hypothetical protein
MTSKDDRKNGALEAKTGHFSITGNDARFRLTDAEVATIASSANTNSTRSRSKRARGLKR